MGRLLSASFSYLVVGVDVVVFVLELVVVVVVVVAAILFVIAIVVLVLLLSLLLLLLLLFHLLSVVARLFFGVLLVFCCLLPGPLLGASAVFLWLRCCDVRVLDMVNFCSPCICAHLPSAPVRSPGCRYSAQQREGF